ncbi:MAG: hypothetical protein Fur0022_00990 [Anaerolineales bacterium]
MDEAEREPVLETLPGEIVTGETVPPPAGERAAAPALTIHIQSWATPIVGVLMLAAGLLTGYFGRPLLTPPVTEVPASESSSSASGEAAPEDQAAQQQALMEAVLARVRHFKGDPAAPVTLIEFSDFQ